jgi:transposase
MPLLCKPMCLLHNSHCVDKDSCNGVCEISNLSDAGKEVLYREALYYVSLRDHVPVDNFYRRLKEGLDLQWLYKSTKNYYGREGQQSIDPVVFFKLILVGYLENLNSDRRTIAHSKMRLDILFFLGYGLDEELPWHSTISRTRALYGEEVFKELFSKVLSLCVSKQMLSGRRQAIDSAYIKANASMDSLVEKEIIEDGEQYLEELQHDDYGNTIEQHDNVMRDDRDSDTHYKQQKQKHRAASLLESQRT